MARRRDTRIAALIADGEALAKRLRAELRKSAKQAGLPTTLKAAAKRATAADQLELFVNHALAELRSRAEAVAKKATAKKGGPSKKTASKKPQAKRPSTRSTRRSRTRKAARK